MSRNYNPDYNHREYQITQQRTDDRRNKYTDHERSHKSREYDYRRDNDKYKDKDRNKDREKEYSRERRYDREESKHRHDRDVKPPYDRERSDDRKYTQEYIPQSQQKPEISEQPLTSLYEAKGQLSTLVRISEKRKQLTSLYNGTTAEQWFLDELLTCFDVLIPRQSGITFLYSINRKVRQPYDPWYSAIISNVPAFLQYPTGPLLVIDLIKLLPESVVEDVAYECISMLREKSDEQYISLYIAIIRKFSKNDKIISQLFEFNWPELKGHQEIAVELISTLPTSSTDNLFTKYASQISYMTQDIDFVHTICAFLDYGSPNVREQIFALMMPSIRDLSMRDPSWNVLVNMIVTGSNEQIKKIAETLQQLIENSPTLPPHFDIVISRLLISLQVQDRINLVSNIMPHIDKLNKPKFVETIKYISMLCNE